MNCCEATRIFPIFRSYSGRCWETTVHSPTDRMSMYRRAKDTPLSFNLELGDDDLVQYYCAFAGLFKECGKSRLQSSTCDKRRQSRCFTQ